MRKLLKLISSTLLSSSLLANSFAQDKNAVIEGRVTNTKGESLVGLAVQLSGTNIGSVTGMNGKYKIRDVTPGEYEIVISGVGFDQKKQYIKLVAGQTLILNFQIDEGSVELDEIVVTGKTLEQEKSEQPIKVDVINTKKLQALSITIPQVINQTAGVRVRQSSGIGSETTININGLQGNAIRFFRDDIPLDYLGRAFDLSLVPIRQLGAVEIYKGVLPAALGADALGGAVNFVSREFFENQLDVSYSFGSFNSHRASLSGYWKIPNSSFFTQVSSYYVSADNDYQFRTEVIDEATQTLSEQTVRRFHDGVESAFVELKTGIRDHSFADLFEVSYTKFDHQKENQNGFNIKTPFGQVEGNEKFDAISARYKKHTGKVAIDLFGAFSDQNITLTDTSRRVYDWFGNFTVPDGASRGESGDAALIDLNFDLLVGRVLLNYQALKHLKISLSHNITDRERTGSNVFGATVNFEGERVDPLSFPANYLRNISGLQLESSFLNQKLIHIVTAKRYHISTSSLSRSFSIGVTPGFEEENYGFGSSVKYLFTDKVFARASYERTTRIPESGEYFGDGQFIIGNPALKPEQSDNLNIGFSSVLDSRSHYRLEINGFYRKTNDQIILQPLFLLFSQYQNQNNARILGVETSLKTTLTKRLSGIVNFTYQDARRVDIAEASQINLEKSRIPYQPYFFSTASLNYNRENLFAKNDRLQAFAVYNFVEKFIFDPISQSQEPGLFQSVDNSNISNLEDFLVPTQHQIDVGITYRLSKAPVWVNLEVNNVLNNEVFDFYRIPKPLRNYRIKIRYLLSKNDYKNANTNE